MAEWYNNYLRSDHWQRTKIKRLLRSHINEEWNAIKCEHELCGLYVPLMAINVHHRTYERLGNERMEDLQIVCRSCHGVIHDLEPELWWTDAKTHGRVVLLEPSIKQWRGLKRIGAVMSECLAYCDLRMTSQQFQREYVNYA